MATGKKYLVDTSVLIALFRKNEAAKAALDSLVVNDTYILKQPNQPILRLADCLIAAFAIHYKMELLTFNKKDFDFIKAISIHPLSK